MSMDFLPSQGALHKIREALSTLAGVFPAARGANGGLKIEGVAGGVAVPVTDSGTTGQNTLIGAVTETAPSTDTASSGLNGRLQRVAQRLTSLIALFPGSIGQKAKAASLAVTLASDEDLLATAGTTADAAIVTDATGSLSGKVRGLVSLFVTLLSRLPVALGANGGLKVEGVAGGVAQPVSGTVTVGNEAGSGAYVRPGTSATWGLAASENLIGLVGCPDIVVTVTPTVLNSDAYDASDLIFDSTEIAAAVRVAGGTAILQSITLIDKDDQKVAMTLAFANAATDFGELDSAPNIDDTEILTVLGTVAVAVADYVDFGGASVATIKNIGLLMKAGAATTSLYVAGVNGAGTPTYTTGGLVLMLGFLRS
jgi:hypothetical protein